MRDREQFGWSQLDCRKKLPPDGYLEGLREHNAQASPVVSHKILGFLETPSSLLASRGQPDRDIDVSRRKPAFMTQRRPSLVPGVSPIDAESAA
jgi:hypothetical protein